MKDENHNSPFGLAPTQVRIIPLKEEFNAFTESLTDKISANDVRVDIDDRNESIGKRIREAEKEWIRYILVIGEKEANSQNLSIRDRQTGDVRELPFDDFINEIQEQTRRKTLHWFKSSKVSLKETQSDGVTNYEFS